MALTPALCSGSTALRALKEVDVRAGQVVVVIGIAGAIGHLAGAIAKQIRGAKVIGTDLASKLDSLDASHFADVLLNAPPQAPAGCDARTSFKARLLEACSKLRGDKTMARVADVVLVAASTGAAFQNLEDYVCDGGKIICVGYVGHDVSPIKNGCSVTELTYALGSVPSSASVSLPINALVERNLHLTGTLMGGHEEALEVMEYIVSGQVKPICTEVVLEDVPEQMQKQVDCETTGKVVVRVNTQLDAGQLWAVCCK